MWECPDSLTEDPQGTGPLAMMSKPIGDHGPSVGKHLRAEVGKDDGAGGKESTVTVAEG